MKKIGITLSGTVIVEMTEAQFDALAQIHAPPRAALSGVPSGIGKMTADQRVSYVRERIAKLKPKKKDGVVRSIAAMFQFDGVIDQQEIQRVIGGLQKEKFFAIDSDGRVRYKDA
jgi:hypothetical protein